MAKITKYEKKNGTAYMIKGYIGINQKTGEKVQTTKMGFKTKKEAKLFLTQMQRDLEDYGGFTNENITFQEAFEEWFTQHSKEVKPTTEYAIKSKFNRILPEFGHLKIKNISGTDCQRVINKWALELKTFKDYKIQANLVFNYALRMEFINRNPMDKVTLPKRKQETTIVLGGDSKERFYTKDVLKLFLKVIKHKPMPYTMFHLLGYTGARKGELQSLHWSDIDFHLKTIEFNKTLSTLNGKKELCTPKTKSSYRRIAISDQTIHVLKEWRKEQTEFYKEHAVLLKSDHLQPVFTTYFAKSMDYCRLAYLNDQLISIYKDQPDLPKITVHGFRHTNASLLFVSGASIKDVQYQLGHSDIKTTMNIYTHVTNEAKDKTAIQFQNYMDE
ncbi:site-specific integrase [Salipaludibacillus neizhouensis]|uniref:Site-specific integrase n=1 Tax=Salipaludibacillus neizhouensis TaxID=885475 RepID=A0A3A9JYU2_9BACI|nr:site-specific integrase [Salipaludibacillus neizhouensis]RKL65359.1 site-specific integrase [Salipaludibacillus neizhouensis]